jgi:hypothetical protein
MVRILTSVAASITLVLALAGPALAIETVFDNVEVGPVTQDARGASPHVTVSLHCLQDYPRIRIRLTLVQRNSSSLQTHEIACVANTDVETTIAFGPQDGTFRSGRATYAGFVSTLAAIGGDQVISIPVTQIVIRPDR